MRTFDVSPLYRSTVGFDRLFDLADQAARAEQSGNWPPYNIERTGENDYRITMAVAGFTPQELDVTQHANALLVSGQKHPEPEGAQIMHRGIATRSFKQTFNLAEHVRVADASLENGLLTIQLVREVPEALKPRRIPIGGTQVAPGQDNQPQQIEAEAKAA